MYINEIAPELRKPYKRLPSMRLDRRWELWFYRRLFQLFYRERRHPNVAISTHQLKNAGVRIYEPTGTKSRAGIFWIHGGGLVLGDAKMNDAQCNHYSDHFDLTVVSTNYRVAPEYPYPAPLDDCYEAWLWFLANADEMGVDPQRIAIAGQSAGGGLAAALCQRIRDEGGVAPAAQMLIYPMLDDRTATRQDLTDIEHVSWNNRNNYFGWSAYLGKEAGSKSIEHNWAVPSRCQNLASLPPAWVGIGDLDLFLDESVAYSEALRGAGVECELIVSPRAPHGFDMLVPDADVSIKFLESSNAFIAKHLFPSPSV